MCLLQLSLNAGGQLGLHQNRERRLVALHPAIGGVPLDRQAAGLADEPQMFAPAEALAVVAPASW